MFYLDDGDIATYKYLQIAALPAVSDVTVSGTTGSALTAQTATLTLRGTKFADSVSGDVSSWFTNRPDGITVSIAVASEKTQAVLSFSGTPAAVGKDAMTIAIPLSAFSGAEVSGDIDVKTNPNAKWSIEAAPSSGGSYTPPAPAAPVINAPQTEGGTTTVSAAVKSTVSGGTAKADIPAATVSKAVDSAVAAAQTGDTAAAVEIKVEAPATASKVEASLPAEAASKLADSGTALTVSTGVGDVTFDSETLNSIVSAEENKAVTLSIETVQPETLSESQKSALGDKAADAVIVDLSLTVGGSRVSELGGTATISIPCPNVSRENAADMVVWFLADDGSISPCEGSYNEETGKFEFKTKHFSAYVLTSFPFEDVRIDAWYYGNVAYTYMNELMTGTDAASFSPEDTMTRAMLVTVLWRMEGEPVVNYAMSFADVSGGEWYSEAVRWAASEKLVNGYENGSFGVSDPITREQLAAILYRYAQNKKYDVSVGEDTNILSYTDALVISEYAIPALQWTCGAGLIKGADGALMPQGSAQRAQVAAILNRFCEGVK